MLLPFHQHVPFPTHLGCSGNSDPALPAGDIDLLVNRTLVYGMLTAVLAATYFGSVILLQYAFRTVTDQGGAVAIAISTLMIAALFQPMRRRIQDLIDRRFYRRRYDAAQALVAFNATIRDGVNL